MGWTPPEPARPEPGWWTELETAADYETRRWAEDRCARIAEERDRRVRRLRTDLYAAHAKVAQVLARSEGSASWDDMHGVWHWCQEDRSTEDFGEVEHRGGGRILGVR